MTFDPEQHMVVVKTVGEWAQQAMTAMDAIRDANGGEDPATLRDGHRIDRASFCLLIEALYAMNDGNVSAELVAMAGLVPVDQAFGAERLPVRAKDPQASDACPRCGAPIREKMSGVECSSDTCTWWRCA